MFMDIICFRRFVTPWLVQVLFWIAVAISVVIGFLNLFHGNFANAFQLIILSPMLFRVLVELALVTFRMQEDLRLLREQSSHGK